MGPLTVPLDVVTCTAPLPLVSSEGICTVSDVVVAVCTGIVTPAIFTVLLFAVLLKFVPVIVSNEP